MPSSYECQVQRDGLATCGARPAAAMAAILSCQVCGRGEAREGEICPYCGAVVRSVLGLGGPLPPWAVAEHQERMRACQRHHQARERERLARHTATGAVLFTLCVLGLVGATLCYMVFHESLERRLAAHTPAPSEREARSAPGLGSMALKFLVLFPLAGMLGAPAGRAVSRLQRGPCLGMLIGAGCFSLITLAVNLGSIAGSSYPGAELVFCVVAGSVPGVSAGYVLSLQISIDGT